MKQQESKEKFVTFVDGGVLHFWAFVTLVVAFTFACAIWGKKAKLEQDVLKMSRAIFLLGYKPQFPKNGNKNSFHTKC